MRAPILITLAIATLFTGVPARDWMGLKRPRTRTESPAPAIPPPTSPDSAVQVESVRRPDTLFLSRRVRSISVDEPGEFLGMLEGLRCFNCTPQTVQVGLSDSLTREAGFISLRMEVWNAIERPLRDRRVFDHGNACFSFGQKVVDTVLVGGEQTEIRHQDKPCYPYLQRVVNRSESVVPNRDSLPSTAGRPPADSALPTPSPLPTPSTAAVPEE